MTKKLLTAALIAIVPLASFAIAQAQTPPAAPPVKEGITGLNLTVTERQPVKQDMVVANIRYEAKGKDARSVQDEINKKIKAGLDAVKGEQNVKVSTEAYSVYMNQQVEMRTGKDGKQEQVNIEEWRGSQAVTLESKDIAKMQELTGKLQDMGFAVSNFGYTLSPEKSDAVRETLMKGAVDKIKRQADQAAKLLGKSGYEIKEISVDNAQFPQPVPMMYAAARMEKAGDAVAAPNAEAGESDVSMTLTARVELK